MNGQEIALPFSYSVVSQDEAAELRAVAVRIRDRFQSSVKEAIEIGRDLLAAKAILGHGNFMPWLEIEFRWTDRTAANYMLAAEHFSSKSETVSNLPLAIVYKLAAKSTPPEVRSLVLNRLAAGEHLDPIEIKHIVQDAKPERKPGKGSPAPSNLQRKRMKEWERENEERELRVRDGRAKALGDRAAAMVRERLGEALDDFVALMRDADLNRFREALLIGE